jgi:hypothetical protein
MRLPTGGLFILRCFAQQMWKIQERQMAKLLTLLEWAGEHYKTPPSLRTLQRWTREGLIYPAPELHGREYKVHPDAVYVEPSKKNLKPKPKHVKLPTKGTLLERLKHGEQASPLRR